MPGLLSVIAVLVASGCAGLLDRPETPIRRGTTPADGVDATPQMPESADGGVPIDPPAVGDEPRRRVWLVNRSDAWHQGLRAHLSPPQPPRDIDAAQVEFAHWPQLFHWAGPDSASTEGLLAGRSEGHGVGVWYDLVARVRGSQRPQADVVADMSWLAARFLQSPSILREAGRPVLVVTTDAAHGALTAAARARLDALGMPVYWVEQIDPADPVAVPPADAIMPRCAQVDADLRRPWRDAARRAGVTWIPCVSPPVNPRLDGPDEMSDWPGEALFVGALTRGRRVADEGSGLMVVDGLGGWRDDRQLDAVSGDPTSEPAALTQGRIYRPYGRARMQATAALMAMAAPTPQTVAETPPLVEVRRDGGVVVNTVRRSNDGVRVELTDASGSGHYELLLHHAPFVLAEACVLRYGRTNARLFVDLVAADGRRIGAPPVSNSIFVSRDLGEWAGRRIEEVLLVYAGGERQLRGEIAGLRIVCGQPEE